MKRIRSGGDRSGKASQRRDDEAGTSVTGGIWEWMGRGHLSSDLPCAGHYAG